MAPHAIVNWFGGYRAARDLVLGAILTSYGLIASAEVQIDTTFKFPDDPELSGVLWVHLLPDGRIYTGGSKVFRLNSDGTLDSTFPVQEGSLLKPVIEPNGGLTVFSSAGNPPTGRRYGPDGAIDSTFQPELGVYSTPFQARRDAAGRYLISGQNLPGVEKAGLIRLKSNGAIDPTFQPLVNFSVSVISPDRRGGWLVTGLNLVEFNNHFLRLGADGEVLSDQLLEAAPSNAVTTRSLIQISAAKYLFGGEYPMLGVFRRDGKLDPSFRHIWGEGPSDPSVSTIVRLKDARVLVACRYEGTYLAHTRKWPLPETEPSWPAAPVFRALPDGMVDLSFNFPDTVNVYDLAVQTDGKLLTPDGIKLWRLEETPSQAVFAFGEKVVTVPESARFAKLTLYRAANVRSPGYVTLTTESSAKARRDFHPINRRFKFHPGEWKKTISLPLRNDSVADGTQSITLKLSDPDPNSRLYEVSTARVDVVDDD